MEKNDNNKYKEPDTKPTLGTVITCLVIEVVLFGISAFSKTEIPIVIHAIIAGVLFGVGRIQNLLGGGK